MSQELDALKAQRQAILCRLEELNITHWHMITAEVAEAKISEINVEIDVLYNMLRGINKRIASIEILAHVDSLKKGDSSI